MNNKRYIFLMAYFALHIKTGSEAKVQGKIQEEFPLELRVFNPVRELMIRKGGRTKKELKPMFPGYIFVETEELTASLLTRLKKVPDFYQVLPSNRDIRPVSREDMEFLNTLFRGGHVAVLSRARFDENDRIQIIDGPLKGKEGLIVKVDRRKGRAKIVIKAFNREHHVDLGFELIGRM